MEVRTLDERQEWLSTKRMTYRQPLARERRPLERLRHHEVVQERRVLLPYLVLLVDQPLVRVHRRVPLHDVQISSPGARFSGGWGLGELVGVESVGQSTWVVGYPRAQRTDAGSGRLPAKLGRGQPPCTRGKSQIHFGSYVAESRQPPFFDAKARSPAVCLSDAEKMDAFREAPAAKNWIEIYHSAPRWKVAQISYRIHDGSDWVPFGRFKVRTRRAHFASLRSPPPDD